jgi:hypothetical protein
MSLVLNAAAACPIFGPRSARAHYLHPPAQFNFTLSPRALELASLQLWCRDNKQRLQLLCCSSCPLSALALRLARAVTRSKGSHCVQHLPTAFKDIVKRCFSAFALTALTRSPVPYTPPSLQRLSPH